MQYVQYWTMFRVQGENIRTALKEALLNNILTNIDIPFRNIVSKDIIFGFGGIVKLFLICIFRQKKEKERFAPQLPLNLLRSFY